MINFLLGHETVTCGFISSTGQKSSACVTDQQLQDWVCIFGDRTLIDGKNHKISQGLSNLVDTETVLEWARWTPLQPAGHAANPTR